MIASPTTNSPIQSSPPSYLMEMIKVVNISPRKNNNSSSSNNSNNSSTSNSFNNNNNRLPHILEYKILDHFWNDTIVTDSSLFSDNNNQNQNQQTTRNNNNNNNRPLTEIIIHSSKKDLMDSSLVCWRWFNHLYKLYSTSPSFVYGDELFLDESTNNTNNNNNTNINTNNNLFNQSCKFKHYRIDHYCDQFTDDSLVHFNDDQRKHLFSNLTKLDIFNYLFFDGLKMPNGRRSLPEGYAKKKASSSKLINGAGTDSIILFKANLAKVIGDMGKPLQSISYIHDKEYLDQTLAQMINEPKCYQQLQNLFVFALLPSDMVIEKVESFIRLASNTLTKLVVALWIPIDKVEAILQLNFPHLLELGFGKHDLFRFPFKLVNRHAALHTFSFHSQQDYRGSVSGGLIDFFNTTTIEFLKTPMLHASEYDCLVNNKAIKKWEMSTLFSNGQTYGFKPSHLQYLSLKIYYPTVSISFNISNPNNSPTQLTCLMVETSPDSIPNLLSFLPLCKSLETLSIKTYIENRKKKSLKSTPFQNMIGDKTFFDLLLDYIPSLRLLHMDRHSFDLPLFNNLESFFGNHKEIQVVTFDFISNDSIPSEIQSKLYHPYFRIIVQTKFKYTFKKEPITTLPNPFIQQPQQQQQQQQQNIIEDNNNNNNINNINNVSSPSSSPLLLVDINGNERVKLLYADSIIYSTRFLINTNMNESTIIRHQTANTL
ncbi:hypothetical protein DFA_08561 [Cavenderia fasciculata]|uniref:Uncharacterized protein n=1 Tax=Cavenderia fasciculata TaxID=261658 RepID=F4Q301_CACFS|nr:uncharacterized protein DFA_08561 [Cavenderia fasciculata]EGG17565.1 hypothetical protein DFA_08561 [Cavenderia fasciculata]|eukprot:XP_004356049.1 hypothetical protein DFA_08561 [Cavenderia fasciculata]